MKAIRVHEFGEPDVLRLDDVPDPQAGPGQLVVRVEAIGVNPVETYIRAGKFPPLPSTPFTLGQDAAGVVESVGAAVDRFRVGQRVYVYRSLSGTYAEKVLCEEWQVHPLPDRATFQQGASIGIPCGAAWRALFYRGKAIAGETLLVHGATGQVGLAAVQLALGQGLTVIATSGSDAGTELVKRLGAHFVVGHKEAVEPERVKELTRGKGYDLILENAANQNLGGDLSALAPKGRVVVIGSHGTVDIDPRLTMGKEIDIRGMTINLATRDEIASMHASLTAALEHGILTPIVSTEIPLAEAARAHREVLESDKPGKIVMVP